MNLWPFGKKSRSIEEVARAIDDGSMSSGVHRPIEVTAVLACATLIADSIATPELWVMRDDGDEQRSRAINEPAWRLLHRRPNEFQTSFEFRQMMTLHAALHEEAHRGCHAGSSERKCRGADSAAAAMGHASQTVSI